MDYIGFFFVYAANQPDSQNANHFWWKHIKSSYIILCTCLSKFLMNDQSSPQFFSRFFFMFFLKFKLIKFFWLNPLNFLQPFLLNFLFIPYFFCFFVFNFRSTWFNVIWFSHWITTIIKQRTLTNFSGQLSASGIYYLFNV